MVEWREKATNTSGRNIWSLEEHLKDICFTEGLSLSGAIWEV